MSGFDAIVTPTVKNDLVFIDLEARWRKGIDALQTTHEIENTMTVRAKEEVMMVP